MEDRYPYVRFAIGAAPAVAGSVAVILFLGGTLSACERGGIVGFFSFLLTVLATGVGYVAVMVLVDLLHALLDIEENTRSVLEREKTELPQPD